MAKNKNNKQQTSVTTESYSGMPEEMERDSIPDNLNVSEEEGVENVVWLDISTAPQDGSFIYLAKEVTDKVGSLCYWKRTRKFEKMRWHQGGKWVYSGTNMNVSFEPKYWRAR